MTLSKRHHFLSQFYLAGFTSDETQKGKIYAFDLDSHLAHRTITKNIAFENQFNKVDPANAPSDALESVISKIESEIAPAFAVLRKQRDLPRGLNFDRILNFIALVGVRNPSSRRMIDDALTQSYLMYLKAQVSSQDAWEKFKAGAMTSGVTALEDMTYEQAVKEFGDPKIRIQSEPMAFHKIEFDAFDKILQLLGLRSWVLLRSGPGSTYVTSDRPVTLIWTTPGVNPPHGPGYQSLHSAILFPVSEELALLGNFCEDEFKLNATMLTPAKVNRIILSHCVRFVYSSKPSFVMLDKSGNECSSDTLFQLADGE